MILDKKRTDNPYCQVEHNSLCCCFAVCGSKAYRQVKCVYIIDIWGFIYEIAKICVLYLYIYDSTNNNRMYYCILPVLYLIFAIKLSCNIASYKKTRKVSDQLRICILMQYATCWFWARLGFIFVTVGWSSWMIYSLLDF